MASKLFAIKLVRFLKVWDLFWLARQRICGKIWVLQCINGIDSFPPIEFEKFLQE